MTMPINVRWTNSYVPNRTDPFVHRVHANSDDGAHTACGLRFSRHLAELWTHTRSPATCLRCAAAP